MPDSDYIRDIVESVIETEFEIQPRSGPVGISFEQIKQLVWARIVSNAVVELIDNGKINVLDGKLYVPVLPSK